MRPDFVPQPVMRIEVRKCRDCDRVEPMTAKKERCDACGEKWRRAKQAAYREKMRLARAARGTVA